MADKNKREAWKNFTKAMKEKRCGTKTTKARKGKGQESDREELTIQRLSAEVHGKAQKYSRVGPREFVDFSNLEMTVENIKKACTDHFKSSIGTGMVCDILAGDQGPSCRTVKQIPNLQLIHVRFIPEGEGDADVEILDTKSKGSPEASLKRKNRSLSPPPKSKMVSRIPPRSLSVSTILQLGRLVAPKTTLVNLFSFHLHSLRWSNIPIPVEFDISDDILGERAFRKAYKAATSTKDFSHATWVIKRYKPEAVKQIEDMNQTVEYQTKKVCK